MKITSIFLISAAACLFLCTHSFGQVIPATYYYRPHVDITAVSAAEQNLVKAKMISIVRLLNEPPRGALTADERVLLQYAPNIVIVSDSSRLAGYYDEKNNAIKFRRNFILGSATADIASGILHENMHAKQFKEGGYCSYWGQEAESEADQIQLNVDARLGGLSPGYRSILQADVRNPTHHKGSVPGFDVISESAYKIENSTIFYSFSVPELFFLKGDQVQICSDGEITFGFSAGPGDPDGIYKARNNPRAFSFYSLDTSYKHGALLWRINPTNYKLDLWDGWSFMGKTWGVNLQRKFISVAQSGHLEFAINDEDWDNNDGYYLIKVIVFRPRQQIVGTLPNIFAASP